jgi:hypothetical protein
MEQLKQAVAAAFDNVVASGAIEAAIEKQLASTIESLVRDQFTRYGDFGKALEAKVSELVQIDLVAIDMPSYSDLVGKIIKRQVEASMQGPFAVKLEKNIASLLEVAPAEITLEKLLDSFVEHNKDYCGDGRMWGKPFTLHIEDRDRDFVDIYLDKEERTPKQDCEIKFSLYAGKVYNVKFGHKDMEKTLFTGGIYNFERELFQLFTAQSRLIVPVDAHPDDFETTFPDPSE